MKKRAISKVDPLSLRLSKYDLILYEAPPDRPPAIPGKARWEAYPKLKERPFNTERRKEAFDIIFDSVRLDTPIHEGEKSMNRLIDLVVLALAMGEPSETRVRVSAEQKKFEGLMSTHAQSISLKDKPEAIRAFLTKRGHTFSLTAIRKWIKDALRP